MWIPLGLLWGFYYYYNNCHWLWRICFFFISRRGKSLEDLVLLLCRHWPKKSWMQSPDEARAALCKCGVFSSPGVTVRSEVGLCASGCDPISTDWYYALDCCVYLCVTGALKHPSELLSQCGGSLPPHSSTATGTEKQSISWTDKAAEAKSFCFKPIKDAYCTLLPPHPRELFLEGLCDVLQQGSGPGFPQAYECRWAKADHILTKPTDEEIATWQECLKVKYTKYSDELKHYSTGNCLHLQWTASSEH